MFNFFKPKFKIIAPADGKLVDLSKVPDKVFAEKLAGDGAAIESTGNVFCAPADGKLVLVFRTNHAFGLKLINGVEILVHIGIDTVELKGEGFERIASEGQEVKAGDPIVKIDRNFIASKGYSLITPVLITNMEIVNKIDNSNLVERQVKSGKDVIFNYNLK